MWARLQFRVRATLPRLGALLSSWKLSVVVMIAGALFYVLLAIWARSTPSHVVQSIATLVPFWAFYALTLLNTGFCLWTRLPILLRDVARAPVLDRTPPRWTVAMPEPDPRSAATVLRRAGYRVVHAQDGKVHGVARRWSALGTYLFHVAFFLLAIGFLTTILFRGEEKVWVAVGEEFRGDEEQYLSRTPPRPLSLGPADVRFTVERIDAQLWRDELLFTNLASDLTLAGGEQVTTRINRPLWLGFGTFLRLSGFGYAPRYEILSGERVVDTAFVKMNVFPPGMRDSIRPGVLPHRIYVRMIPDLAFEDGVPFSQTLNLVNPAFETEVYRGRRALGDALLRPGETIAFEGLALRFPEVRYWGEFTILRDPGAPLIALSFLLGLGGLLLKLRGKRAEVVWASAPERGGTLKGFGAARPPRAAGGGAP
jgi:hypothetical protein